MYSSTTKLRIITAILLLSSFALAADGEMIGKLCAATEGGLCEPPYIVCRQNKCAHKEVFAMEMKEFLGTVLLFVIAMLAVAAGIGGGELFVPI
jgi:uncharacterized membrane protein YfcA